MKKNKEYIINSLRAQTTRDENECIIINEILNNHFIVGHNNKDKIKTEFITKLNISDREANELYNICSEIIVKGIFK